MITKILFTTLIVVALLVYARHRGGARRPTPRSANARRGESDWMTRALPAGLLLVMVAISSGIFWLQWREEHRLFTVRVIDTRSGDVHTYTAYRDDVHGRSFKTIDGRVITLADVERMEVLEGAPTAQ